MNNKHILLGLVVLTISCIYLFYLNFQKYKDYEELSIEVNKLKVINNMTQTKIIEMIKEKNDYTEQKIKPLTKENVSILPDNLELSTNDIENINILNRNDINNNNVLYNDPCLEDEQLELDVEELSNAPGLEDEQLELDVEELSNDKKESFNIDYVDVMTIKELRIVAKNIKVSPKGNKNVLIKRIKEQINSK